MENRANYVVAVIGAGPAGLYAARELANQGIHVALINRDIKPGGLAEYGIYPDKHKMKEGLRAQFKQIITLPNVRYYGNVMVGEQGDLRLTEIQKMGFQAILVTVGAQGTKWLGLPGESLHGVYHAKDIVYHYNQLPPYSGQHFKIGRRVAIVGVGNVMADIAHYLLCNTDVEEITAIARRGPGEIKFDKKELEMIAANMDVESFERDVERLSDMMYELGQNPSQPKALVRDAVARAQPCTSKGVFRIKFLASPVRILGNENDEVSGLEVESNTLIEDKGHVRAVGTEECEVIDVDTVIFAIGDKVDENFGLPTRGVEFNKSKNPDFPIENVCFEVYDDKNKRSIPGIFVAGWARQASTGLVGIARKDGTYGARALMMYLSQLQPTDPETPFQLLEEKLESLQKPVIKLEDLKCLEQVERQKAAEMGLEEFKFSTNEEMLHAMHLDCDQ